MSDEVRIAVRVTTRAGVDRIDRNDAGILHLRVAAAPTEGAANLAVLRLLGAALGIAKGRLRIVSGETGRNKVVAINGISRAALASLWPGLADPSASPMAPPGGRSDVSGARASGPPRGVPRGPRG